MWVVLVAGPAWGQEPEAADLLRSVSSGFVENAGQWETPLRFVAQTDDFLLGVGGDHLDFLTRRVCDDGVEQHLVRLVFVGADETAAAVGQEVLPGTQSFFFGRDPARWITGAERYASVVVPDLYPGIDLVVKQHPGGMEYDLVLAPGADLDDVVIRCEGIEDLRVGSDDTLELETAAGPMLQRTPVTWGQLGDARLPIGCRYRIVSDDEYGFTAHDWSAVERLVVDPVLEWSSFLGGQNVDRVEDVAVDDQGVLTVVGWTDRFFGLDFPVVPGSFFTSSFNVDAFATRIDPSVPALVYSAVFGSLENDEATSVALGPGGRAFVAGRAGASDFPVTPGALQTTFGGLFSDAFLLALRADGSAPFYSTFVGGSGQEGADASVVVDRFGVATLVTNTESADVVTTPGAYQSSLAGSDDVLVTRVSPDGSTALFTTYVGGSGSSSPNDAALVPDGDVVFVGSSILGGYPTTPGAFSSTSPNQQFSDAFVTRLSADGSTLVASTLLAGTSFDFGHAVSVLPGGDMVVVGRTSSSDFPTTSGVLDPVGGGSKNFVARVAASAQSVVFSTFLGGVGSPFTQDMDVIVDASGVVTVTGGGGNDFPVTPGSFDPVGSSSEDGVVARLDPDGKRVLYATYLTGSSGSGGVALDERPDGVVVFAGNTSSSYYPTTPDATQSNNNGGGEGVVTVLDLLPTGVERRGPGSSSCLGPVRIGVLKRPDAGVRGFGFWSSQAPPNAYGFLLVNQDSVAGMPPFGGPFASSILGVEADAEGWVEQRFGLIAATAGDVFHVRFVWANTPTCGTPGNFSVSDELVVTVQ